MPLNEGVALQMTVAVDGTELPVDVASLLVSIAVDHSLHVPDLAELRFSDPLGLVLAKSGLKIGGRVQVRVNAQNPRERGVLLTAEVTSLECEVDVDGVHLVVRALDPSHRLLARRRVEAYVQVSAGDVVKQVAARAGVATGQVDGGGPEHPQLTQDGVTDWDFLRRLAAQAGRQLRMKEGKLELVPPQRATEAPGKDRPPKDEPLALKRGENLEQLRAVVRATGLVPSVEVRGWDPATKKPVVATAQVGTASAQVEGETPRRLASLFQQPPLVRSVPAFRSQEECTAAAKGLVDEVTAGFAEVEGRARGNPALRPGAAVVLSSLGSPFDGKYTLTATRHEWTAERAYVTWFTASGASDRSLWGALDAGTPAPAVRGPVTAVVTNNKDPEKLGRVKVTFPVLSDTYESAWARVVSSGGGKDRGSAVLPEVNDEVLVLFGMGSMDDPYVVGGLHNGVDTPRVGAVPGVNETTGAVERRAFTSRTGMVVEMVETQSQAHLTVSNLGGAQKVSLVETPEKRIDILSEGAVNITAKTGDVTVKADAGAVSVQGLDVKVKATKALTLEGATVSIKGQTTAELAAPNVKVAADAMAELSGGATTTVRGAIVRIN